jgi:hypothetical protein
MKSLKLFLFLTLTVFLSLKLAAQQTYNWHYAIGGFGADATNDIAYGNNGDVVAAGYC